MIVVRFDLDETNKNGNAIQKEIGQKMKKKEDASDLLKQKKDLDAKKIEMKKLVDEKEAERDAKLSTIGNVVHSSVPTSNNEVFREASCVYFAVLIIEKDNNEVLYKWPENEEPVKGSGILAHDQVLQRLGGYDSERGKFYFLIFPENQFVFYLRSKSCWSPRVLSSE